MTLPVALFLPDLSVGGAETVTIRLLRHLDRRRVRPVLVLLKRQGRLLDQVPPDVPVVDLGRRTRAHLPAAALRLGPALREHGVRVLLSQIEVPTLVSLVARPLLPRGLALGMIEHSVPSVYLSRNSRLLPLYRRVYRAHDFAIAVSSRAADDLRRNFMMKRVHVVHDPIDRAALLEDGPAPHPWLDESVPTIVSIARLDREKGPDILLKAFERVRTRTRARLLIFGEGRMKLPATPDVTFAGHVDSVGTALRRATVFALASRVEGFALAAAEAMTCGAPIAATRCGVEEYLRDGENALLAPVEDPAALAEAILKLLGSADLRRRLGETARRDAARFDADGIARQYEDVLASEAAR